MHPQRPEGPGQGVAPVFVHVGVQGGKSFALGQPAAAGDAMGQRAVTALQKADHGVDGVGITFKALHERRRARAAGRGGQGQHDLVQTLQAGPVEQ